MRRPVVGFATSPSAAGFPRIALPPGDRPVPAPLWITLGWLLIVIAAIRALWMAFCRPAEMATLCPRCGYPVDPRLGLKCAECGTDAPNRLELNLRRRTRGQIALAAGVFIGGMICITVFPTVSRYGVWGTMPNALLLRWGVSNHHGEQETIRRIRGGELDEHERAVLLETSATMLRSASRANQQTAWSMVAALQSAGDNRTWDLTREALRDPSAQVRGSAVRNTDLQNPLRPDWVDKEICGLVASDPDPTVRRRALLALAPLFPDQMHGITQRFTHIGNVVRSLYSQNAEFSYLSAAVRWFEWDWEHVPLQPHYGRGSSPPQAPVTPGNISDPWLFHWIKNLGKVNESAIPDLQRELDVANTTRGAKQGQTVTSP